MATNDSRGLTPLQPPAGAASPSDAGAQPVFPQEEEQQNVLESHPTARRSVDCFGMTLCFMTALEEGQDDFCVLRGVIPPGGSIPLHSHPDMEDFFILLGKVARWLPVRASRIKPFGVRRSSWLCCPVVCGACQSRAAAPDVPSVRRPPARWSDRLWVRRRSRPPRWVLLSGLR
jgi:hypothetical protein